MRIFLTGGTGFLGSHFICQALAGGYEVFALRRPGSRPRIPIFESFSPLQIVESSEFGVQSSALDAREHLHWLDGSLTDDWSAELRQCDVLVHLAAVGVSPQIATWQELFQVNVLDSLKLWRNAVAAGLRRFVICGSCLEYGSSADRYEFIPPDAPLLPTTGYGASKAAASVAALGLASDENLEMLILRSFHMYGEGQHERNFWRALRNAASAGIDFPMTPGEQIRDFMPVEDAAAAFLTASLSSPLVAGRPTVQNLGSGRIQSLSKFAAHWWKVWGATGTILAGAIPYREGEVMRYAPELNRNLTRMPRS